MFAVVDSEKSPISTIVIRGATDNLMDDIERAVDDGINAYKGITKVSSFTCINKLRVID